MVGYRHEQSEKEKGIGTVCQRKERRCSLELFFVLDKNNITEIYGF